MNDDNIVRLHQLNADAENQRVLTQKTKPLQRKVYPGNSSEIILLDDDE